MRRRFPALFLGSAILAVAVLSGCASEEKTPPIPDEATKIQAEKSAIKELIRKGLTAANQGQAVDLLTCYSDSVACFPQASVPLKGKAELLPVVDNFLSNSKPEISYSAQEIEVFGATAFERGAFMIKYQDRVGNPIVLPGTAAHRLEKNDSGNWIIVSTIWNLGALE